MNDALDQMSVLVIDDEESTRRMLRLLLKGMGYRVLLAPDGESGLELFAREKPRLVLTDVKMPGMDGLTVLRGIKEASPRTEVLVVTGHGDMDLAITALKLDASDFLTKPIQREALEVGLKRAAERARVQDLLDSHTKNLEGKVKEATAGLEKTCLQLATLGEINRGLGGLSGVAEIVEFIMDKVAATAQLVPEGMLLFDSEQRRLSLWGCGLPRKMGPPWAASVAQLDKAQTLEQLGLKRRDLNCEWTDGDLVILAPALQDGRNTVGALLLRCPQGPPQDEDLSVVLLMLSQAAGAITRAVRQEEEFSFLQSQLGSGGEMDGIVGSHPKWIEVLKLVNAVADTDSTALILGESGTGKELVARRIHRLSSRRDAPFEVIHCAAFPQTLLESELFGHEKGAFTGADKSKKGSFERADGGTVFLDELGGIPLPAQVKLLRVLQFREFKRLGGEELIKVDVRVVAATSSDLQQDIAQGNFREDLYYRLNVVPIHLPPLRQRMSDLPALAVHFLGKLSKRTGKVLDSISPGAMEIMQSYSWPGNVRELENALEHAFIVCKGNVIKPGDLPPNLLGAGPEGKSQPLRMREQEKRHLSEVLARCGGNRMKAARTLGISRSTLYRKMQEYGLK